jgi:hypothetical protein
MPKCQFQGAWWKALAHHQEPTALFQLGTLNHLVVASMAPVKVSEFFQVRTGDPLRFEICMLDYHNLIL